MAIHQKNNLIPLGKYLISWRNSRHLQTTQRIKLFYRVPLEQCHTQLPLNGVISKVSLESHSRALHLKMTKMPYWQIVFTYGIVEFHRPQVTKTNISLACLILVWTCTATIYIFFCAWICNPLQIVLQLHFWLHCYRPWTLAARRLLMLFNQTTES